MTSPPTLTVDPAFAFQPGGPLDPTAPCDTQDAWRYLSSLVARDPLDVEAHSRRVWLAARNRLSPHLTTALLDTFLALGSKGRALREQLLGVAAEALPEDELAFFRVAMASGLSADAGLPLGTLSVLDPGLMGRQQVVHQARREVQQETLAEQAAALIDQGDLPAARQLLEAGLLENPQDDDAARELLAVYRHSRDHEAESAMRQRLTARFGSTPASWA